MTHETNLGRISSTRLRRANTSTLSIGLRTVASLSLMLVPVLLWFSVPGLLGAKFQPLYLISLAAIGLLAIFMISYEARRATFSLHLVHWIFVYVFFFVAPLVQYKGGVFPWRRLLSTETGTLLTINLAILIWCSVWIVTRLSQSRAPTRFRILLGPRISSTGVFVTLVLAIGATSYLIWSIGFESLLVRAGYNDALSGAFNTSSSALVMDKLLRGLPVAAAAGSLWFLLKSRVSLAVRLGVAAVSLLLLLIADFPLGSGRHWSGAIYLGLLLAVFGSRLRSGWPFVLLVVSGLLIIFPLVGDMRNAESLPQAVSYMTETSSQEQALATGDFDAYAMVGYTAEYISEGSGITYGRQLLAPLLFFLPREMWPDKPVGSGWTVAVEKNLSFDNVSSPPVSEGLINFGWLGVGLFSFGFSWAFGVVDASFRRARQEGLNSLLVVIYPFWVGFAFLLLRGDLLSSTAFIVGFSVSFLPLLLRLPRLQVSSSIPRRQTGFRSEERI